MKLHLYRTIKTNKSTTGELWIDGVFFCFTLEDVVRPEGEKVYGKTAIPAQTYKVVIDDSVRFRRPMPHILDVPKFDGVRIHSGNTAADTDGCILVGYSKDDDVIYRSKDAFNDLLPQLQSALAKQDEVILEIS